MKFNLALESVEELRAKCSSHFMSKQILVE